MLIMLACLLLFSTLIVFAAFWQKSEKDSHVLVITSDFNSVRRCGTHEELMQVARIMISARPDIVAMDAASPDLVNFKSAIGHFIVGSNFDALFEAGYDPYGVMVDTLKKHGITVLANIRMNDHHGREHYWSPWERDHVDWSLGKDTGTRDWRAIGELRHMDYAIEGVGEYRLSILEEIVSRYDVDGIQLDFGRTAPFVSEPKRENAKFLTEYIRDVRNMMDEVRKDQGNKRLLLGAILPWDPAFCMKEGLDVGTWIQGGLVDFVSPGEWYYSDWNIPLRAWKEMTENTHCKLFPFTLGNVSPYQQFEHGEPSLLGDNKILDGPMIRAIADNFFAQGCDGFAFYNFYTFDFGQYYPELREWTNPEKIRGKSKHYLFCRRLMYHANERDTYDLSTAFERFPLRNIGDEVELPFRFSNDLSGTKATLRFAFKHMTDADEILVTLNDKLLSPDKISRSGHRPKSGPGSQIAYWESAIESPPLIRGENAVRLKLNRADIAREDAIKVGEFEIVTG